MSDAPSDAGHGSEIRSGTDSAEPDEAVKSTARADLSDAGGGGEQSDLVTEFHAAILEMRREALTLRQRAMESSALNSFAARSELGGMEAELAALHRDVRGAYGALLADEYDGFDRVSDEVVAGEEAEIERHHAEIRKELDTVSAEVMRTRSAISDQKVTQMLTSALILGLLILLLTAGIFVSGVV